MDNPHNQPLRVGVIGAGPAGLTAAYQLAKQGAQVEVFEAGPQVGGLAKTIALWDQKADLGPHRFFCQDSRVNRLWLEVVGKQYHMVDRLTRIYYQKRFFNYPLKPFNALRNMGVWNAAACLGSYLKQRGLPREAEQNSFEDWVVDRFGRRLFEMFFKSYSEKLWGISCQELDADFAAQRIKKFSLGEAVKTALGLSGRQHKTLADRFAYPVAGTGQVYEAMAEAVGKGNGRIHLRTPVRRAVMQGRRICGLETCAGAFHPFDHVISTMPLTELLKTLEAVPAAVQQAAGQLRFRNTILVYLLVDAQNLFPDQWLYVHSPELEFGRLTNFRNWVPELHGPSTKTILCLEYWCYDQDPIWTEESSSLIARARQEIQQTGLAQAAAILEGHVVRLPKCYPVYARGYRAHLDQVVSHLRTVEGLVAIGRYGAFKYNNQDHSILMGLLAAENLLQGTRHDLWSVNTDYESYQESSRIDEAGLVPQ